MEPLNTFFRISPGLLNQIATTPRSGTSSSFSSPSFADHQTGLKVYRDSPPSLSSAHQVVDDNPLFEGFHVLPPGARNKRGADCKAKATEQQAGHASKLQEQLQHLLTILQHALELHNSDGLPDGLAPRLADELEAMAKKLKEKEREAPVERQLRTKVQMALTGAEATIRKLRATPWKSAGTGSAFSWCCNDPADPSPTCSAAARKGQSAATAAVPAGRARTSVRDSVCKQLLQSPSSSMSPLSWGGPVTVACSPLFGVDEADMASPKELPAEQQWRQNQETSDGNAQPDQMRPAAVALIMPCAPDKACKATEYQPPLYSWMKAILASASKQEEVSPGISNPVPGGAAAAALAQLRFPEKVGASTAETGSGLAAAVRTALASARKPLLVYGSPLHRRIQRLLAEQRSPSPLRHIGAQADVMQAAEEQDDGLLDSGRPSSPGSSRGTWGQPIEAESPVGSVPYADTTSSCDTPLTANQDVLAALPFRSSVSPFGPTLRERYGAKAASLKCTTADSPTAAAQTPAATVSGPDSARSQQQKQAEAAELIAQLGLDLQLDPETAGNISELEVLEHVERWAREQYIAAQKALLASVGQDGLGRDSEGVDEASASFQALVDIAIQTESPDAFMARQPLQRSSHAPELRDVAVGTAPTPRLTSDASPAPPDAKPKQQGLRHADKARCRKQEGRGPTDDDDGFSDICSPARSDQAKRSPAKSPSKWLGATAVQPTGKQGHQESKPRCPAASPHGARKHYPVAEFGSTPARRGLFRGSNPAALDEMGTSAPGRPQPEAADDPVGAAGDVSTAANTRAGTAQPIGAMGVLSASTAALEESLGTPVVSQVGCRPCSGDGRAPKEQRAQAHPVEGPISKSGHQGTPAPQSAASTARHAGVLGFRGHRPAVRSSSQPAVDAVPEVLLTPGSSFPASNMASTGRHTSGDGSRQQTSLRGATAVGSIRALETQFEEQLVRSPVASDVGPAAPLASSRSGCDEFAPEVLFTPGNSQPGGKSSSRGKRRSRIFRLDSGDADGESVVYSVRTLSSISSVSIIASMSEGTPQGNSEQRQESRTGGMRESEASSRVLKTMKKKTKQGRPSLSRSFLSVLVSIATCVHVKA